MLALLSDLELALTGAGDDTIDRLRAFAAHHLAYHMDKKREVFIANSELRALNADNRRMIVGLRRRYEGAADHPAGRGRGPGNGANIRHDRRGLCPAGDDDRRLHLV